MGTEDGQSGFKPHGADRARSKLLNSGPLSGPYYGGCGMLSSTRWESAVISPRRRARRLPSGNGTDLLQRTLDLLILKTVSLGPLHGELQQTRETAAGK